MHSDDERPLAARDWSDGEVEPDGAFRFTDTDWHDVTFAIERVHGQHFTITQSIDDYTFEAQDYSPQTFTFNEVVFGASGQAVSQQLDDIVVTAVLDGQSSVAFTDSFGDGNANGWADGDGGASPSVVDGTMQVDWPGADRTAPRRLLAVFPNNRTYTLNTDGDTLTLTFRTRLTSLHDDNNNRLLWGLADTRPEEHGMIYQPELSPSGWRLTDHRSPLIRGGEALTPDSAAGELSDGQATAGAAHVSTHDIMRRHRPLDISTIGAAAYNLIVNLYDHAARLEKSTTAGTINTYTYDSDGRVTSYTRNGVLTATYQYDIAGRRVGMNVGHDKYRFVYEGHDIIAEYVDEGGDGLIDRTRVYLLGGTIDQRLGGSCPLR